jgi:hypothetical protein
MSAVSKVQNMLFHTGKILTVCLMLFYGNIAFSQDVLVLTPSGFDPVEIQRPAKTNEKLIEASKAWAPNYNKQQFDLYNITENSLDIDAVKDNAFYYRNLGEVYNYGIKYSVQVNFGNNTYTVKFVVKEIYAKRTQMQTTIADFFMPDGSLKEDFEEVKPSLERTANNILKSYIRALAQY